MGKMDRINQLAAKYASSSDEEGYEPKVQVIKKKKKKKRCGKSSLMNKGAQASVDRFNQLAAKYTDPPAPPSDLRKTKSYRKALNSKQKNKKPTMPRSSSHQSLDRQLRRQIPNKKVYTKNSVKKSQRAAPNSAKPGNTALTR